MIAAPSSLRATSVIERSKASDLVLSLTISSTASSPTVASACFGNIQWATVSEFLMTSSYSSFPFSSSLLNSLKAMA